MISSDFYYVTNTLDLHIFENETATLLNFFEISTDMHFVSLFFLNERNIAISLLMIHFRCTFLHYAKGLLKKDVAAKMAIFGPPPPMSPLVTILGYPLPPCHRVNSDKLSLRIQVTKTIWGHFKNSNDTRNYDKSAKFLK